MDHEHASAKKGFWRSRSAWVFLGFLAIAGFFLIAEHRAHLLGWLPFVLLALCPLMHLFGHGGHGGSGNERRGGGHEH